MLTPSMHKRRVLFVINSLVGGGAERVLLELIKSSQHYLRTYDISLALLDDVPRQYTPPSWLEIHQLKSRSTLIGSIKELQRLLKVLRPDVTVSFLTRANVCCGLLGRIYGHASILSERVNTTSHLAGSSFGAFSRFLVRYTYPFAHHLIAVSDGIGDDLKANFRVRADRLSTIPNPIDAARIVAASSQVSWAIGDAPYAVAVSRLTKNKNVILLVEAIAESKLRLPLVILGEGPEEEAIRTRAKELGISDLIIMLGFVDNPYPIMKGASCYISGSNAEGFPNGLVEALALGVPVIATNCPSGPSEVLHRARRENCAGLIAGEFGVLVPQNDAIAMAAGIKLALEPLRKAAYAQAGPVRAADFNVGRATKGYWDIIENVLLRHKI